MASILTAVDAARRISAELRPRRRAPRIRHPAGAGGGDCGVTEGKPAEPEEIEPSPKPAATKDGKPDAVEEPASGERRS